MDLEPPPQSARELEPVLAQNHQQHLDTSCDDDLVRKAENITKMHTHTTVNDSAS
jgi:hypothetical protein